MDDLPDQAREREPEKWRKLRAEQDEPARAKELAEQVGFLQAQLQEGHIREESLSVQLDLAHWLLFVSFVVLVWYFSNWVLAGILAAIVGFVWWQVKKEREDGRNPGEQP